MTEKSADNPPSRLRRAYVFLLLTGVHSLLLLCGLELAARAALGLRDAYTPPAFPEAVLSVYRGMSPAQIRQLLDETWQQPWRYEPWVGFREQPRRGRYVNVSEQGFRLSGPDEPDLAAPGFDLFVFGGSTIFGYGVDDLSTVPASLQVELAATYGEGVRVFNFGRGYYYSAQELALFLDLLRRGHVPEMAIFVDGLNEGQRQPYYTAETRRLVAAYNQAPWQLAGLGARRGVEGLALGRIATGVLRRMGAGKEVPPAPDPAPVASPEQVRDAYLHHRRLILAGARQFGVETYFFIQPVPGHRNRFGDHPLRVQAKGSAPGGIDPRMRLLEQTADGDRSFSLTGLLEHYPDQPFVDSFHYTPEVCSRIASAIREHIEAAEARRAGAAD